MSKTGSTNNQLHKERKTGALLNVMAEEHEEEHRQRDKGS